MPWDEGGPDDQRITPSRRIRLLLCAGSPSERTRLRGMLDGDTDVEIVGSTEDAMHLLRLVGEFRPDVVLTAMDLPQVSGTDLVRLLAGYTDADRPGTVVVVSSGRDLAPLLRTRVNGVVEPDVDQAYLRYALRAAAAGEVVLSPRVARWLIEWFRRSDRP